MAKPVAVQMKGISKFFGEVVANKGVDLTSGSHCLRR